MLPSLVHVDSVHNCNIAAACNPPDWGKSIDALSLHATASLRHATHGAAACASEMITRIGLPVIPACLAVLFLAVRTARRTSIPT
ncbi:hypothetical protein LMG23994_00353 [Cupriavidus pinatubonensis]|uniref:Uncharacterized protein n=1 Tax=Cupriavidus pinatubonensis TaxID=248026 RepID=A0ABM8WB80_9BURK|nr:hypothetical protein LMG23994_00353 [Cupriavidus pinatubonensis]